MRSPGHRKGNITHRGLLWGGGRGWGTEGGIALGEIPNVDDGLMGAANVMAYVWHMYTYVTNLHIAAHVSQKLKHNF